MLFLLASGVSNGMPSTLSWKVLKVKWIYVRTIINPSLSFFNPISHNFSDLAGFLKTISAKFAAIGVEIIRGKRQVLYV